MADGGDDGAGRADDDLRDFAIVVGVTRYPDLVRDGAPADLRGPINDAKSIRDWLISPRGGNVPQENIEYVIRDRRTAAASPDPTRDAVVRAFGNMFKRCWPDLNKAPRVPTGRRLYVYVSGHGLAIDADHGALLCSNSSNNVFSTVAPHPSIMPFRKAGYFQEFVVWFDGCMDWTGVEAEVINYNPPPGEALDPPGPVFTAYAARPRLRAVEAPDAKGKIGGVFTRTLLAGLNGGAVDQETNNIDGDSLRKYLFNTMATYLPATTADKLVDKQPFIRTDPGITFVEGRKIPRSVIVFTFDPAHNGSNARIWGRAPGGSSLSILATKMVENGQISVDLPDGIYMVDVPDHGLRTGFEVTGGRATKLSSH